MILSDVCLCLPIVLPQLNFHPFFEVEAQQVNLFHTQVVQSDDEDSELEDKEENKDEEEIGTEDLEAELYGEDVEGKKRKEAGGEGEKQQKRLKQAGKEEQPVKVFEVEDMAGDKQNITISKVEGSKITLSSGKSIKLKQVDGKQMTAEETVQWYVDNEMDVHLL